MGVCAANLQRHVLAMVRSAATRLGYEYAVPRVSRLFDLVRAALRARESDGASRPGMRFRWGAMAAALGAALLYAVLRDDGRPVDLAAVALACDVPYAAATHALTTARALRIAPLERITVNDPALYTGAQLEYLEHAARGAGPPSVLAQLASVDYGAARRLAVGIARMCAEYELPHALDAPALAYAIVMHAIEGAKRAPLPVRLLADEAPAAMQHRPASARLLASAPRTPEEGASRTTVLARYAEVERMLSERVAALPWLAVRPVSKRERDRRRRAPSQDAGVARRDVAYHLADAVTLYEKDTSAMRDGERRWTTRFAPLRRAPGEDVEAPAAPAPAPLAERLHLTADMIAGLSDEQVDERLFTSGELATYLRTDEEQRVLRQLKGWDVAEAAPEAVPEAAPAPTPAPTPAGAGPGSQPAARRGPRIRRDATHLLEPLDLSQQADEPEWEVHGAGGSKAASEHG